MRRVLIACVLLLVLALPATAFGRPAARAGSAGVSLPPGAVDLVARLTRPVPGGKLPALTARRSASIRSAGTTLGSALEVVPIAGDDRIDTALAVSRHAFPQGAQAVIITNGYNWPDALSGASLAGMLDVPILLTPRDRLPASVRGEIDRLGASAVIILGGEPSVSSAVEGILVRDFGEDYVLRIGGRNRYETSAMIASLVMDVQEEAFGEYDRVAFLATGANFPDALGASPLSTATWWPIVLVNPGGVDQTTAAVLGRGATEGAIILGSTKALSGRIGTRVEELTGLEPLRLDGANRYETALRVSAWGVTDLGMSWDRLALTTGEKFPDALAGGVMQGRSGSVMLLTPSAVLPESVAAALGENTADIFELHYLGGLSSVSQSVRDRVESILFKEATPPPPPPPPLTPGPVNPIPATLWRPPAESLPASGNYVYLDSDDGDYIGQGREYLYTAANAWITASATGNHVDVGIDGGDWWYGDFRGPTTVAQLQPGYYGNLQRYPFHDPVFGGLSWSGEGRGSNTLTGWFVVDSVTYTAGVLTAIDLRFEQHSEGGGPALHGAIHWSVDSPIYEPSGEPVNPIPDVLWRPSPESLPATGNYVYLDSDAGDYIGQGREYLYTPASDAISVSATGGHLSVHVNGNDWWYGEFQTMSAISQLQSGYYCNLRRYPFHDPVFGGLSWSGEGRGSNTLTGWFVVDSVTYTDGALTAIDLRFEQHSEGRGPALHGAIHWTTGS